MTFGERLKSARLEAGLKQSELASLLEVGNTAVSSWERDVSKPDLDTLTYMCGILGVSISYFVEAQLPEYSVTIPEYKHIKKYRSLDSYSQETVSLLLDREVKRRNHSSDYPVDPSDKEPFNEKGNVYNFTPNAPPMVAEGIAPYNVGTKIWGYTAAGGGAINYDKTAPVKVVHLEHVPNDYDFALEVSGDSMYPVFEDKEIIFVKETEQVHHGMIGVVEIDGDAFIKKLYMEGYGMRLVSLNVDIDEKGERLYPDFYAEEFQEIHIIGKVII
jgi:phage repressor protein C with HTH and peptisase S24 domain/DNA-binding XRE family transcriptional regulator